MHISIDKNTEYIISALESAGFSAYAVGGCVRDAILGREVTDVDITTSALPDQTKNVFSAYKVIETGIKHGTVTVIIDRTPYEITTFRTESEYTDSRHPDKVTFVTDVVSDLARRDFTVNSIAYSPKKGIIDPFGGVSDIHSHIIRAVGEPSVRFSEDALRILRALRFSSVLGFEIEDNTSKSIFSLAETLSKVSKERIYVELKKLLCGKNASAVLSAYRNVIENIIPIHGDISQIEKLPTDYRYRFSALCGTSVAKALSALRADNETKTVCTLLSFSEPIPTDHIKLKHYISSLGRENALNVVSYRRALYGEDSEKLTEQLISSGVCLFLQDLAITGKDLLPLGIKGKAVGETLNKLLNGIINGEIDNNRDTLLHHLLSS